MSYGTEQVCTSHNRSFIMQNPESLILTDKTLRELLSSLGCTMRKYGRTYRINTADGDEASAYYTNNRQDAFDTAVMMRRAKAGR